MTGRRIAYFTGSYPALTETFVQREIDYLRRQGWDVKVFAFARASNVLPGTYRSVQMQSAVYGRPYHLLLGLILQFVYLFRNTRGYWRCLSLCLTQFRDHPIPIAFKQVAYLLVASSFSRLLHRHQIGHIHAHFATASTMALFCHYLTGIQFSMAAHASGDIYTVPIMLGEKAAETKAIIAESQYNIAYLDLLTADRYSAKCHVVYNGVEISPPRERVTPGGSSPHIVSVAGLRMFKGFPTLLNALALIRDAGHEFRCTIVGEGPMRAHLEQLIQDLKLFSYVKLAGAMEHPDAVEVMRGADIFVLASEIAVNGIRDGLPTVCTEAMSLGLPVISTYVSGIPELVQHERTGLLVPEKNPPLLADAIIRLIVDPALRRDLAQAGYEHVRTTFNAETTLAQLERIFTDIIAPSQTTPAAGPQSA